MFSLCVSVLIYWPVKSRYANKAVVIHMSLTTVSRVNLTWAACTGLLTPGNTHPSALSLLAVSELNHKFRIHMFVSGGHVHQNAGSALFILL